MTHPVRLTSQHSHASLDVIRGVSALVVFAAHIGEVFFWRFTGPSSPIATWIDGAATAAVGVFFLLSGHLITVSILQNIEKNGHFEPAEYLASRISRIYPPLIGAIGVSLSVVALVWAVHLPGGKVPYGVPGDLFMSRTSLTLHASEVVAALAMVGGLGAVNGPLWSLYAEFQIYLVAMCLACWWRGGRLAAVGSSILALTALLHLKSYPSWVAVWSLGSVTALLGWRAAARFRHWPKILIASGNFSYSLYVLHFPLLLMVLSITQNWVGRNLERQWFVAGASVVLILGAAAIFAKFAENQRYFKAFLKP